MPDPAHSQKSVVQFEIGSMKNFVYLVLDWNAKRAAMIDPQKDLSRPLGFLRDHQLTLECVLLTHSHHDHIAGVPELAERYPTIPIYCHPDDAHRMGRIRTKAVREGDVIFIGSQKIQALHTPGHSAGEICYLLEGKPPALFSGDTLFIRDCGRTDLPTGDDQQLFESLQRLKKLDPTTVIYPGHHYAAELSSTLEAELQNSPPLKARSVKELTELP
jgi:hydroxyacylglutathione hydrolase